MNPLSLGPLRCSRGLHQEVDSMLRTHPLLPLAVLVAGSLSLTSCSRGGEQQAAAPPGGPTVPPAAPGATASGSGVTIHIVTNGVSPFWDPMAVGMDRAAKKYGCRAAWSGPQTAAIPDQ